MNAHANSRDIDVDHYLPVSTKSYDLRRFAEDMASWNEDFVFDLPLEQFFRPSTVILFEILDYNPLLLIKNSKRLNRENFLPIAWGYLRPNGASQIHLAQAKVQLWKFQGRHSRDNHFKHQEFYDGRRPDVLLELAWPQKSKYPSFLEVEVMFEEKPSMRDPGDRKVRVPVDEAHFKHWARHPWEVEYGL